MPRLDAEVTAAQAHYCAFWLCKVTGATLTNHSARKAAQLLAKDFNAIQFLLRLNASQAVSPELSQRLSQQVCF